MGMDLRVLIGVFVTLFGIAVGMAGGDIDSQDLQSSIENLESPGEMPSLTDFDLTSLTDLLSYQFSRPANTSISAELSTDNVEFRIRQPARVMISLDGGTSLSVGDAMIQPSSGSLQDVSITLLGFTGTVSTAGNMSLKGKVSGIDAEGLSLNYSRRKSVSIQRDQAYIRLQELDGEKLLFQHATGTIERGSTDLTVNGERALFEFFEGEITITPVSTGYQYMLDGKVYRGTVGEGESSITIGGNN